MVVSDVFLSHASEDKDAIARPLAERLRERGFSVWYDEYVLKLGDSLPAEIDRGLASCRFGVVILSPHFFAKGWPKRELDGLAAREVRAGQKVILPVWHEVSAADVEQHSPTLAAKLAVSTAKGLEKVVQEIVAVLGEPPTTQYSAPRDAAAGRAVKLLQTVYIGNLPYSTTGDELQEMARVFVPEATAELIIDSMTKRSRGFGLIHVSDAAAAALLIEAYNGRDFGGRSIVVNQARERPARIPAVERQKLVRVALTEMLAQLSPPRHTIESSEGVTQDLIAFFAKHPEEMRRMPHRRFEELVAELWRRFGYDVELTKQTRDGGIDIIAVKHAETSIRCLIECKRHDPGKKVSVRAVRELLGVKHAIGGSRAILATTVYFSSDALEFLETHRWDLQGVDYDGIVLDWLGRATGQAPR